MRSLFWLLAAWLGWQVFKEAQREYADTIPSDNGLAPVVPPFAEPSATEAGDRR